MTIETDLAEMFFKAKQAAYVSPMTIKGWEMSGKKDYVLVDVRKSRPFSPPTRIPNSIWIPEDELESRIGELPKDKELILYCWDTWCSLATSAAVLLFNNGYKAKELYGGVAAWTALKLPLDNNSKGAATDNIECSC